MCVSPVAVRVLLLLINFLILLFATGCATIIKGTHQDIPVSSDPSSASVLVDGVKQGITPIKLNLARKTSHVVTIELNGFETESVTLKPSIGGAVAGNIIAGGLIGWGVDAGTGAQYNLHPESVHIRLRSSVALQSNHRSKIDEMLSELEKIEALLKAGDVTSDEYAKLRASILIKYQ